MLETSYGTSHLIDSSGTPIHCVASGSGPLIVLIHGFPDFWYTWRAQIPTFARSYRTVAVDLRGFNRSGKPEGVEAYRIDLLCGDVRAVVEHFHGGAAGAKATIVGHDWGGIIGWYCAMLMPELVERLVVLNAPHPRCVRRELAVNDRQRTAAQFARDLQRDDATEHIEIEKLISWVQDEADRREYREALGRSSFAAMSHLYQANYPREPYPPPEVDAPALVRCPVLMLHGLGDRYLLPGCLNATWEYVASELTLITIPDFGHFIQQDAAGLVTDRVLRWLGAGPDEKPSG
jgi:pimeloyl-ACP methyl ester carboxylesterase